ncbi:MAG: hypothetical protein U1E83_05645 [Methylotetracoccus sp.]
MWLDYLKRRDVMPLWQRAALLGAYGRQQHGIPESRQAHWLFENGLLTAHLGRYDDALHCHRQALDIWQAALPAGHQDIASMPARHR